MCTPAPISRQRRRLPYRGCGRPRHRRRRRDPGGVRRLYEGLGAPELWIFEGGAFAIWGTSLYWWAAMLYLAQVRSLASSSGVHT